jgi:hypothetical protein
MALEGQRKTKSDQAFEKPRLGKTSCTGKNVARKSDTKPQTVNRLSFAAVLTGSLNNESKYTTRCGIVSESPSNRLLWQPSPEPAT